MAKVVVLSRKISSNDRFSIGIKGERLDTVQTVKKLQYFRYWVVTTTDKRHIMPTAFIRRPLHSQCPVSSVG